MLSHIFPPVSYTHAELVELAGHMNAPVVKKFLKDCAIQNFAAISSGLPEKGETVDEYLLRQAVVVGSNAAIEKLLAIEPVKSST
jgi:hypothetical protein